MSTPTNGDALIVYCAMGCGATTMTSEEAQRQISRLVPWPVGWMCQRCADERLGVDVEGGLLVGAREEAEVKP